MLAILFSSWLVFMQVNLPPDLPLQPSAPLPSGPRTSTTTTSGNVTVNVMPATPAEIEADAAIAAPAGMNGGAIAVEKGLNKLASQSLQLPEYLLTRDKKVILENPAVKTLNEALRYAGLALWVICICLVIAKHLAGPFVGADIMDLSVALPVAIFMGTLGWFNQQFLSILIDMAGAFLGSIVNAHLKEVITPGLSFNTLTQLIVGPIIGIFYDLLSIWLIFKVWLQLAWLWILTAGAPIYITITGAPFLGKYGSHWWRNWFGTLIDPVLTIIGLHLIVPWFDLLQGAPDLAGQLGKALTMLVIISTVGWHVGAYRPQGVDALIGIALFRMLRNTRSHTTPSTPATLPPPQPPNNPHAISGQGVGTWIPVPGGTGGGTAASWWKTGQWAVA